MKESVVKKIERQGVYLYGVEKKVEVVSGIDLFGHHYFTVVTKGFEQESVLNEDEYKLTFALKPF